MRIRNVFIVTVRTAFIISRHPRLIQKMKPPKPAKPQQPKVKKKKKKVKGEADKSDEKDGKDAKEDDGEWEAEVDRKAKIERRDLYRK